MEVRVAESHAVERAGYEAKLAQREARAKETGKRSGGKHLESAVHNLNRNFIQSWRPDR